MDGRQHSNDHLPEVTPATLPFSQQNPYSDYEFFERPHGAEEPPAPEYRQHASPALHHASPALSAASPPLGSERATSPSVGDTIDRYSSTRGGALSPSSLTRYSEVGSPAPQAVPAEDKQVYHYQAFPVPENEKGYQPPLPQQSYHQAYQQQSPYPQQYQQSFTQPQAHQQQPHQKKRVCGMSKKLCLVVVGLIALAVIAIAVACGVVFGSKHQ